MTAYVVLVQCPCGSVYEVGEADFCEDEDCGADLRDLTPSEKYPASAKRHHP